MGGCSIPIPGPLGVRVYLCSGFPPAGDSSLGLGGCTTWTPLEVPHPLLLLDELEYRLWWGSLGLRAMRVLRTCSP